MCVCVDENRMNIFNNIRNGKTVVFLFLLRMTRLRLFTSLVTLKLVNYIIACVSSIPNARLQLATGRHNTLVRLSKSLTNF